MECPKCHGNNPECFRCDGKGVIPCSRCGTFHKVDVRYSFSVYAGIFCEECAINGFRDSCGIGQSQGNPADLDEPYEEE